MNDERYDLIFRGELVAGFDLPQVKKNLQALFRLDEAKVSALFTGKAIPLKKGLDADAANKYRVAMKKAGARVDLIMNKEGAAPPPPSAPSPPSPAPSQAAPATKFTTSPGAQAPAVSVSPPVIDAPNFGLAAPGADLLKPEERYEPVAVTVDISHLAVVPQRGNLVNEEEVAALPGISVTVPDLDLAAVGSDLLLPEERPVTTPVEVDISRLTLVKVGERLEPPKAPPPPPPNVDHLTLKK